MREFESHQTSVVSLSKYIDPIAESWLLPRMDYTELTDVIMN